MTPFSHLKQRILKITGSSWINLAVAKQKAGIPMIRTVEDAEKVLKVLTKPRKITPPVPSEVRDRYNEAHRLWFTKNFPESYKDHGWTVPVMPKVHTGNGLSKFCINFIEWHGFRAHGIAASGRKVAGKWIPGRTRAGASDVSATIHGKSWMIEIKAGKDRPSEKQLKEQYREERAGGRYDFVHSAGEFLQLFDQVLYG